MPMKDKPRHIKKKKQALTIKTFTRLEYKYYTPKHVAQCVFNKNSVNIIVLYITTEIQ